MMILMLLAGVSRCASPHLCPTDKALREAIREEAGEQASAYANAERAAHPDEVIQTERVAVTGISAVRCGTALAPGIRSMRCSFNIHRGKSVVAREATLVWQDNGWSISDAAP